jgi:hypothetical protein
VTSDPLAVFVGRWRTRGRTTDGTDLEIRASDDYEWLPGRRFVVHRWTGKVGPTAVHGLEVLGRAGKAREYRTHFFDGEGNEGSSCTEGGHGPGSGVVSWASPGTGASPR